MQADGRSEGSISVSSGSRQPPPLPEGRATPPTPPQSVPSPASHLVATAEPSQTAITHLRLPPSYAPPASRKIFAKRSQMTRLHVPRSQKSQQFSHLTPSCISQVGTEEQRGQETLQESHGNYRSSLPDCPGRNGRPCLFLPFCSSPRSWDVVGRCSQTRG